MIRQRNDTGGVLESHEFGISVGPGEEFLCSLPVPGCTILGRIANEYSSEGEPPQARTDITEGPSGEEFPA